MKIGDKAIVIGNGTVKNELTIHYYPLGTIVEILSLRGEAANTKGLHLTQIVELAHLLPLGDEMNNHAATHLLKRM